MKAPCILVLLLFFALNTFSQKVIKSFTKDSISRQCLDSLSCTYTNKKLIIEYEAQILIALSYYPELKDTKIKFRLRNARSPLMTRPTVFSTLFRTKEKRTYLIIISKKSKKALDSILISRLPYDAQIGVIGHELAHVSYFIKQNFLSVCRLAAGNLSVRYMDKIEFETDRSTIDHGLGWQLLSWSEFVRNALLIYYWKGADSFPDEKFLEESENVRERYMNPSTIKKILAEHMLYKK